MSNTQKTAGIFGPSAEQMAAQEAALNKFYGDRMISSLGAGAGVGLGAAAIYHLLRQLKQPGKNEKKYVGYGSGSPVEAKMAGIYTAGTKGPFSVDLFDATRAASGGVAQTKPVQALQTAMSTVAPTPSFGGSGFAPQKQNPTGFLTQQNQTLDPRDMLGLPKGRTEWGGPQNGRWVTGGLLPPPGAKLALDLSSLSESLGKILPKSMIPFSLPGPGGGGAPSSDPHAWRKAWGTAANIGAGALGLYGGKKVVDSVMQAKKKRDLEAEMEAARQDYYSALAGDKAASSLDFAFETVKHANILETISNASSALFHTPQTLRTAYLLAMLGAGGVGAKYMYDKTKATTEGENLAKAQASRARTKGLPTVWVDPESLSNVKALAGSHE